jgi:hypothetical protein
MGWLTGLGDVAAKVIGATNTRKTRNNNTATTKTAAPTWLMPALVIGGALIALLVLFAVIRE